jgi:hypothetical protein
MTVKDLIEELEGLDGDLPVIAYDDYEDWGYEPISVSVEAADNPFEYGSARIALVHVVWREL